MPLANRIRFGSSLRKDLWSKFEKFSDESRINKSRLLDEAIEDLLIKYGKLPPKKGQCPF